MHRRKRSSVSDPESNRNSIDVLAAEILQTKSLLEFRGRLTQPERQVFYFIFVLAQMYLLRLLEPGLIDGRHSLL